MLPGGGSIDQRGISLIRPELRRKEKESKAGRGRKHRGKGRKERRRKNKVEEHVKRQFDLLLCDGLGRDRADEETTKEKSTRGWFRGGRMTAKNTWEERGVDKCTK